jgi:anthranilate phosphoribosyltransferase
MQPELKATIDRILGGQAVPRDMLQSAMAAVMDGRCGPAETAALLTALAVRGETADELAGAAQAMRDRATVIPTSRTGLLDTCGTGGDALHTYNISTAAALVAAAAGVPVAKHGNRSVSSSSGSCDVLEALGVNVELSPRDVGRCIDEVGIGFCFARVLHTAMRHVAPVRAELGFRTIFNLLGPLTNPARAEFQLIGTGRVAVAQRLASALARLGTGRTLVVCGNDELDEVALWGTTTVFEVRHGDIRQLTWTAAELDLPECRAEDLRVSSPAESAAVIRGLFSGEDRGPRRDMLLANAAAALLACGAAPSIRDGIARAAELLDSGAVQTKLDELVEFTRRGHEAVP